MGTINNKNGNNHGAPMYAEERQRAIAERARDTGRVEVAGLASVFGVSAETIRRDLSTLEGLGLLRRTHGGAVPVERFRFEPELAERQGSMSEEKARIARAALRFVPERGAISLDAGTTTGALAELLPENQDLTVVTNCLPIASALASRQKVNVVIAGGRVRARTLSVVDDLAARFLDGFVPDVAFVAANGVTVEKGLTTPDVAEAAAKRAMIRSGRRVILLADHTKLGQEHFARFAELGEVDALITDDGVEARVARELEKAGVEVVRA
jgi:DeoR family fructose operon transcriptional repressor